MVRTVIPDKTTALTAAQAVCAALFARERSGKGQYEYDHPGLGRVRQPRGAARFSEYPPLTDAKAPKLGQHSVEVLAELGYSRDDIHALQEQGVVGGPVGGALT